MHETVKVKMDASYPYSDFDGWYESLAKFEREYWVQMAKDGQKTESAATLLAKKAMELYCLEMDIDTIPNSEEYLEKIYQRLINNLIISSLADRGMVKITEGKLSFISEPKFAITAKGKNYLK